MTLHVLLASPVATGYCHSTRTCSASRRKKKVQLKVSHFTKHPLIDGRMNGGFLDGQLPGPTASKYPQTYI